MVQQEDTVALRLICRTNYPVVVCGKGDIGNFLGHQLVGGHHQLEKLPGAALTPQRVITS